MVYISLPPEPLPAEVRVIASISTAVSKSPFLEEANDQTKGDQAKGTDSLAAVSLLAQLTESDLPTLSPTEPQVEDSSALPSTESTIEIEAVDPDASDSSAPPATDQLPEPTELDPLELDPLEFESLEQPASTDSTQSAEEFASELQLTSDAQEFNPTSQTITARGNVTLTLGDAIIEADELWVNLINRYALAEGDVLLTRGSQLVEGNRLEYNFVQQSGRIGEAVGTIYLPAIEEDFSSPLVGVSASRRAYDPIRRNPDLVVEEDTSLLYGRPLSTQPPDPVRNPQDAAVGESALINQLRFETDELTFDVDGWRAEKVRITNDPFSPPEIELRTDGLLLRNISPTQDELLLRRPRLVFDQGLAIPLVRSRILLSRGSVDPEDINPVPAPIGIDGRDRGGFFLGRKIPLVSTESAQFDVTPQLFVARALSDESDSLISSRNFGLTSDLDVRVSDRTRVEGNADLTSFEPEKLTENLRASLRLRQLIGDHRLSLQAAYRERLFNGSLGFQDVQASLGAVLLSPVYVLGETGLNLTYQASAQLINAETDRQELLEDRDSETGRVTIGRYQGSVALSRRFNLWQGEPKPATQERGLRYTPQPVVPYIDLNTGLRTTFTYYGNGDTQDSLLADVGIEAQLGHFARDFGDYTRLNIAYSQSFFGEPNSPFLFDREVDRNVLSFGITQQLYGPILAGFQTAISFNEGEPINTIYSLEYSRRTYGLLLRYDTTQNTGSIGFRLSGFRWIGDTNPFDTPRLRRVQGGVVESR